MPTQILLVHPMQAWKACRICVTGRILVVRVPRNKAQAVTNRRTSTTSREERWQRASVARLRPAYCRTNSIQRGLVPRFFISALEHIPVRRVEKAQDGGGGRPQTHSSVPAGHDRGAAFRPGCLQGRPHLRDHAGAWRDSKPQTLPGRAGIQMPAGAGDFCAGSERLGSSGLDLCDIGICHRGRPQRCAGNGACPCRGKPKRQRR
jgi:hypothetical protein